MVFCLSKSQSELLDAPFEENIDIPRSYGPRPGPFGFIRKYDKAHPLYSSYEPQRGLEDGYGLAYPLFALIQVFDPEARYFKLVKKGAHVSLDASGGAGSPLLKTVKLFFGYDDVEFLKGKTKIAGLVLWLLGGFLLSAVMNVIKLSTEFMIKLFAELCCLGKDGVKGNKEEPLKDKNCGVLGLYGLFRLGELLFSALHVLVRMGTSPILSMKAALNSGYGEDWGILLACFSLIGSFTIWGTLLFASGPLLALVAPKLSLSLLHTGLATFSAPIMSFFDALATKGAVALTTFVIFLLGMNEARKGLSAIMEVNPPVEESSKGAYTLM